MAQWNLSVDLRGRGTNLAQTLRRNAGHARDLGTAVRDTRTEIRQLGTAARTSQSGLRSMGSAAHTATGRLQRLERRAGRAAQSLRQISDQARRAEERLRRLNTDVTIQLRLDDRTGDSAALALRQVQEAAEDTARVLRTLRGRAAATAAAFDELRNRALLAAGGLRSLNTAARTSDTRLEALNTRTMTLTTSMGELNGALGNVTGRMGGLRGNLSSTSNAMNQASGSSRHLLVVAGMLATALLPIAAAAGPIAVGLGAAGIAAGAFGIAIGGQIKALTDAAEAQTKYDEAVREHGRSSEEAAKAELEQVRILRDTPAATRKAAAAYEQFTDDYKAFSDALADDTMPVATKTLGVVTGLLQRSSPLAKGASREIGRFMTILAGGMNTGAFDTFMGDFTTFAVETLARANSGIIRLARGLNSGEIGGNLREFFDYARANGPAVADTLSELFTMLLKLVAAGSEAGVSMLTVVNAFAQLVNAIPTDVLSTLLQVAFALKAVQLAGLGMAAVAPVMGTMATNTTRFVRAARFGGVASAIAGVTQQLTLMQRASIVLAVLAVAAMAINELADNAKGAPPDVDRLTTSLKNLGEAGKFTGELQKTFGDMKGFVRSLGELKAQTDSLESIDKVLNVLPAGKGIEWLGRKVNDMTAGTKSISALQDDFKGLDESMASLATSGNADLAAGHYKQFTQSLLDAGYSTQTITALFPEYQAAVAGLKAEQDLTARSMGVFGQQALDTKTKLDAQKLSADGLRASIVALNETNRAALGGMIGFEQAIDDAAEAAAKNADALTMTGGKIDLNSQKARDAAAALENLGTKTDEAATAARASGAPWSEVNAIYDRGRAEIIRLGDAMGLTKPQAQQLAQAILDIPDEKETRIEMDREDALAGLDQVIQKIEATPGAKSVTVSALTADAMRLLGDLGYKTEKLPNGQVKVTAITGQAVAGLAAVKAARDALDDRTITITTYRRTITENILGRPQKGEGNLSVFADGGIVPRAANGLFVPGYAPRRDTVPAILSPGEGVLVPETVRQLGAATGLGGPGVIKALNAWGRYGTHMGGARGPMPFADGGTVPGAPAPRPFASGGFVYAPTGMRRSTGDVQSRYDQTHQPITRDDYNKAIRARADAVDRLRDAEGKLRDTRRKKHTAAELAAAERKVAIARRSVATATESAAKAEARYRNKFSLSDWAKTLKDAVGANASWETNLRKIATRGGGDVIGMLRDLGEEGAAMVAALAKASNKQFNEIIANLRKLGPLAKATLADFTAQLNGSNKATTSFQANLAQLAAQGFGALATMLAAQGDDAAMKLAADAVKDKNKAAAANASAKTNSRQLSQDELAALVQIIAAVRTSKTGIHDVAATTGLGEDEIITIATKASTQIKKSLGTRSTKFLADLARANRGLSYANGGIREGIYATRAGAVTFAEPSTGGEAYIPLGAHKRSRALPVLREAASRMGVGITDLASRQVVVVREAGDTFNMTIPAVRNGPTAAEISSAFEHSARRARRGGVAHR
ncbi:hypothetical protein ACFWV1_25940 [Streptomyces sp. NPDC058700]|uniref:hypothetical protein n=1 Tax=Streptomyces sp. NPDC058700 TaxID=3346607 RepID=UPI003662EA82